MIRIYIRRGLLYRLTPRVSYLRKARMFCFYRIGVYWAPCNRVKVP